MFCIKLAGISIGIDNQYPFVLDLCYPYLTDQPPAFTVRATEEDLRAEEAVSPNSHLWYRESICIYRRICLELPRYDAFLMHAAVVAVDGRAYVFSAPSGVGKTTHLKQWLDVFGPRVQVVNGDKPIFRFIDGVLYACGTPWMGKERLGSNLTCPVDGICFLERGQVNEIRPLSLSEVNSRLFHQVLLPTELDVFDRFWALLERMLDAVPFYLLRCKPEPDAALTAYNMMRRVAYDPCKAGISDAQAGQ